MNARLGKYGLLKRIAAGGMAEIWLAKQHGVQGFEKLVVLKRILPNLADNAEFVQMFLDEAKLAAQLSHPNIVQIFELGRAEGSYFIAMEYVHGENLRTVAKAASRTGAPMPVPLLAKVISQACEALSYAHTKTDFAGRPLGIVHRDVSPQNLLVSFEGQVKVVDFGIAKAATQVRHTRTGVLKGKYAYMSPEQCRAEPLDARSDIFSLGIVLWELATGARLFKHPSELMILKAITEEETPAPSRVRPGLPPALEAITLKALAKRPDDRFQSGDEMHMALESFLLTQGDPVSPIHLADYMTGLFPEKVAGWQRIVAAQDDGHGLGSELFDDLGSLFAAGTPSGTSAGGSGAGSSTASGARPLIPIADAPEAKTTTDGRSPAAVVARRQGGTGRRWAATLGLAALAVLAGGGWLLHALRFPKAARSPAAALGTGAGAAGTPVPGPSGTLLVDADPPANEVVVDGRRRASTTPARIPGLALRTRHRILVEAPGYLPWRTEVTLGRPGGTRRLTAHLEAAVTGLPAAMLAVTTEPPGATVYVDGIRLPGTTPLRVQVPEGHPGSQVRLEAPGYASESHLVDLGPGRHASLILQLRRLSPRRTDDRFPRRSPHPGHRSRSRSGRRP